ncbi:MAG: hypothetical protein Q9200_002888 [Gallowayella weberi]
MVFNTITVSTAVTPTVIETYFSHYLNRKPLRQKPTAHVSYHEGLRLIRRFLNYASFHTVEDIQAFTSQWVPNPPWVRVDEIAIPEKDIDHAAEIIVAQLGHKGIDKIGGSKWWQWRRNGSALKAEWIEMRSDYDQRKPTKEGGKRIMLYVHGGAYFFGSVDEHRYQIQRHARKLGARVLARVAGDASLDYIPPHGFLSRPSTAWPPPNSDDMEEIALHAVEKVVGEAMPRNSSQHERQVARDEAVQGFSIEHNPDRLHPHTNTAKAIPAGSKGADDLAGNTIPGVGHDLSIMLDGKLITIKDQIQMYATNQLISHPLVSPVLQPSLGGLPPLLILTGGGEMLRDEQIYLAHKAANPSKYPPGEAYMNEYPEAAEIIAKYKPTDVQLQVWDDMCHVAPTLSFTRPAKLMYRSIAQFGAWALAKAQKTDIDIMDDDDVSVISSGSDTDSDTFSDKKKPIQDDGMMKNGVAQCQTIGTKQVGKAGEPLPAFRNHMIRQRVDRHGNIFPLGPPSSLPALQMSPNDIGVIKPGPVRKWMEAKKEWDNKFAKEKRKVQKQRAEEIAKGYQGFGDDEVPPPSALAGRRGLGMEKEIKREEKADKEPETTTATPPTKDAVGASKGPLPNSRSRSRRRIVSYTGQSEANINEDTPADELLHRREVQGHPNRLSHTSPSLPSTTASPLPSPSTADRDPISQLDTRHKEDKPFPVTLNLPAQNDGANASTLTLRSVGLVTPMAEVGIGRRLGYGSINPHDDSSAGIETTGRSQTTEKRPQIERFETAREEL